VSYICRRARHEDMCGNGGRFPIIFHIRTKWNGQLHAPTAFNSSWYPVSRVQGSVLKFGQQNNLL